MPRLESIGQKRSAVPTESLLTPIRVVLRELFLQQSLWKQMELGRLMQGLSLKWWPWATHLWVPQPSEKGSNKYSFALRGKRIYFPFKRRIGNMIFKVCVYTHMINIFEFEGDIV